MNDTTREYLNLLTKKYNKVALSRKEIAEVLNISLSSVESLLTKEQMPIRYKRVGKSQKAKYAFPIIEVANYLAFAA